VQCFDRTWKNNEDIEIFVLVDAYPAVAKTGSVGGLFAGFSVDLFLRGGVALAAAGAAAW